MFNSKKTALVIALTAAAVFGSDAHAAQISAAGYATTSTTIRSFNNNFTMLNKTGGFQQGANDVAMTWDGTVFTASSDYTGPGSVSNMTLSTLSTFSGYVWTAHDVQVFAPGTYAFDSSLNGGGPETGIQTMVVRAGQLGAHMLFDWQGILNVDVSIVWDTNGVFGTNTNQQTLTGTAVWNSVSVDPAGGDGIPGIKMQPGGPFANFNLNGITPNAVPVPAAVWLLGSGLLGVARRGARKSTTA